MAHPCYSIKIMLDILVPTAKKVYENFPIKRIYYSNFNLKDSPNVPYHTHLKGFSVASALLRPCKPN